MIKVSVFFSLLFLCFLLNSCNNNETKQIDVSPKTDQENNELIKNQFIKANQQLMQKENDEMDYYAKSHQLNFTRTGSGIRYFVYKPSIKGDSIKDNMQITLNFTLKLMDGTLCYSSKTEGSRTFFVGHEDIESGIHKGLKYLKRGDKAILLIPSPLAHGLLGDFNKIPPQMPIVYDVEVD